MERKGTIFYFKSENPANSKIFCTFAGLNLSVKKYQS